MAVPGLSSLEPGPTQAPSKLTPPQLHVAFLQVPFGLIYNTTGVGAPGAVQPAAPSSAP